MILENSMFYKIFHTLGNKKYKQKIERDLKSTHFF